MGSSDNLGKNKEYLSCCSCNRKRFLPIFIVGDGLRENGEDKFHWRGRVSCYELGCPLHLFILGISQRQVGKFQCFWKWHWRSQCTTSMPSASIADIHSVWYWMLIHCSAAGRICSYYSMFKYVIYCTVCRIVLVKYFWTAHSND